MKINPNEPVPQPDILRNKKIATGTNGTGKKAPAAGAAFVVELSSKLNQMTDPKADEARQARVAAIRAQLAAGDYNISGKDVADKILDLLKS